jgi:hypothetical protein
MPSPPSNRRPSLRRTDVIAPPPGELFSETNDNSVAFFPACYFPRSSATPRKPVMEPDAYKANVGGDREAPASCARRQSSPGLLIGEEETVVEEKVGSLTTPVLECSERTKRWVIILRLAAGIDRRSAGLLIQRVVRDAPARARRW